MKDILDSILSGNAADVSIIPVMNIDTSNPVGDMENLNDSGNEVEI